MTDSGFVFEEGEAIVVGSHGEHDFVYHEGTEVTDAGVSTLVFEEGTGLGGRITMEGTAVGVYETNESHASFWNQVQDGNGPDAEGLAAAGINDSPGEEPIYVFVHRDTGADTYAIGAWARDGATNDGADYDIVYGNLGAQGSISLLQGDDIPPDQEDVYTTDGNGDPLAKHGFGWDPGDGDIWDLPKGSYTLTLELSDYSGPDTGRSDGPPLIWRGRGPDDSVTKTAGHGSTFEVQVSL